MKTHENTAAEAALPTATCRAEEHKGVTDTNIIDWLEANCLLHWPFGNEIQVTARCLSAVPFKARPTLREAVESAINAKPTPKPIDTAHNYTT